MRKTVENQIILSTSVVTDRNSKTVFAMPGISRHKALQWFETLEGIFFATSVYENRM